MSSKSTFLCTHKFIFWFTNAKNWMKYGQISDCKWNDAQNHQPKLITLLDKWCKGDI